MNWTKNKIKSLRKRLGMRLEEFAVALDYSASMIHKVENGERTPGRKLCKALNSLAEKSKKEVNV